MSTGGGILVTMIQVISPGFTIANAALSLSILAFSGVPILTNKKLQRNLYGKNVWRNVKTSNRGQTRSISTGIGIQTGSGEGSRMSRARGWLRKTKRRTRKFGLCDRCGKPFSSFRACYHVYSYPRNRERCHWGCIEVGEGIMMQESADRHVPKSLWKENQE
jgi:hypothetical protein